MYDEYNKHWKVPEARITLDALFLMMIMSLP